MNLPLRPWFESVAVSNRRLSEINEGDLQIVYIRSDSIPSFLHGMVKWLEHSTCSKEVRGSTRSHVIPKTSNIEPTAIVFGAQRVNI